MREIKSLQHPLIKHLVHLRRNRDYRYEHQALIVEGLKLIGDAHQHMEIKTLLVCDQTFIPEGIEAKEIILVSHEILKKILGTPSVEGILAEIAIPAQPSLENQSLIIALDNISDPGNLGTILRTALALGWGGAFILENSCDPFNDKALRAAKGATFRLPIRMGSWAELKHLIEKNHLRPLVADMHGVDFRKIQKEEKFLLVLSNESRGVSESAHCICEKIKIPMSGKMESLNVAIAGGILMQALVNGK